VSKVCVAYDKMERYFPKEKIVVTGNPVRSEILLIEGKRGKGLASFGFVQEKKTVLVIGGSLGARTINESIYAGIEKLIDNNTQVIWQTGKQYFESYSKLVEPLKAINIRVKEFVMEMDMAYAAADVVISRSGAIAISELCIVGKPVILVPSPNVAEDHQTKNAMALVEKDAAIMITDKSAKEKLVPTVLELLFNPKRLEELSTNIKALAKPNATEDIVNEIEKLIA
jgi:UDP-N-acetylglucosamine--N-acetylmuramyl-(pentapeptide) pyrophosphoryl-undecaprenol N-acetylglucosamine transferase